MQISLPELYQIFLKHPAISTDTRKIEEGCLFFALKGETFDGNNFAAEAVRRGAAFSVIDNPAFIGERTLLVPDVLLALQELASLHRSRFNIPVLAITGTNGKTTTKELINNVLESRFRVVATHGNLNNHIGVPLTLLTIHESTEIAIIEMGANHPGEIEILCNIANPTHGLITNIGKAHLEGFGGYQGVIKTKSELYQHLRAGNGTAFVNGNDPLLFQLSEGIRQVLYGSSPEYFVTGFVQQSDPYLEVVWKAEETAITLATQLVGDYNYPNVMAAICAGRYFGVPESEICRSIAGYIPANSRSQHMKTMHNTLILDAYNANPSSMQAALQNFGNLKAENKMVLLGDMLELGEESASEHKAILDLLRNMNLQKVLLVGPGFSAASEDEFISFSNSAAAAAWLRQNPVINFTILVKGSRGIRMENVVEVL